jgi:predicted phage terminase large subunit-like protein
MTSLPLAAIGPLVAFCDPARGKPTDVHASLKRLGSRSAVVVCGSDALGRVFVLYAWAKRCATDVLIEHLYTIAERFRPKVFGVEASGLQSLFTDALARDAKWRGRYLPLLAVEQPTTQEKDFRIRTRLQPIVGHGRLFLLDGDPGVAELKAELTTFPQNPLKDLVDALASATTLLPHRAPRRERDAAVDDLVAHLRATGAPPEAITAAQNRRLAWTT